MQIKKLFAAVLLTASVSMSLHAAEPELGMNLKQELSEVFGGQPDRVAKAPLEGLLEVTYGGKIFYVSSDGRFLINGELFDLASRTNLTEKRLSSARLEALADVDQASMIVYKANGKEKHSITVFTDIDCVYCRKLHKGMEEMNDLGITVRYMSYPRAGLNSPSYYKAVSVWCADDRNRAMDLAKNEGKVSQKRCDDAPVEEQLAMGEQLGVTGTPAIIFEDGSLMPGYAPPQKLFAMLEGANR